MDEKQALEMLLRAKKIIDAAALPDNQEYYAWNGEKLVRHAVKLKSNVDALRNRLAMHGMKLDA